MLKKEYRLWYLPICNCQVTHCCSALARSLRKKRAVARKNIPPRTTTNGQSMSAYPKLRNSQSGDSFVLCRIRSEIYKRRAKKISHLDENRHYNVEGTELPKQPPTEHMHAVQNGRLCSEEAECPPYFRLPHAIILHSGAWATHTVSSTAGVLLTLSLSA